MSPLPGTIDPRSLERVAQTASAPTVLVGCLALLGAAWLLACPRCRRRS